MLVHTALHYFQHVLVFTGAGGDIDTCTQIGWEQPQNKSINYSKLSTSTKIIDMFMCILNSITQSLSNLHQPKCDRGVTKIFLFYYIFVITRDTLTIEWPSG